MTFLFNPQKRLQSTYEPVWKNQVDRWYQLDENSFAICEALSAWKIQTVFDSIVFICEGSSNLADADFVNGKTASPAKFVYTLPNLAPSVGLQLLKWHGPVHCFCISASDEAAILRLNKLAELRSRTRGETTFFIHLKAGLNPDQLRVLNGYFVTALNQQNPQESIT